MANNQGKLAKKKKEDKVSQSAIDIMCQNLDKKFQDEAPKLKNKAKEAKTNEAKTNEEREVLIDELKADYAKYKTDLRKVQSKVTTKKNSKSTSSKSTGKSTSAVKLEEGIDIFLRDEIRKLCLDLIIKSFKEYEASSKASTVSQASLLGKKVNIVLMLKKNLKILQPFEEEDRAKLGKVFTQLGKCL